MSSAWRLPPYCVLRKRMNTLLVRLATSASPCVFVLVFQQLSKLAKPPAVGGGLIVYAVASHRVDSQWRYALALQNQCSVVRFPQGVTRVYLSFFLGRSWLVWPHFFLRQLTARGCRRA